MNPEEYDIPTSLVMRLKAIENLEILSLYGYCPVQAEGFLDGKGFYFRSRDNFWRMEVGHGRETGEPPTWWYSEIWPGDYFSAGWMSDAEALACVAKAAETYNASDRAEFQSEHLDYTRTVLNGWCIRALRLVDVVKLLKIPARDAAPLAIMSGLQPPSTADDELDWIIRTGFED